MPGGSPDGGLHPVRCRPGALRAGTIWPAAPGASGRHKSRQMKTRQTASAATLAGLPSTGGAAARGADDAHGRFAATAAGHPRPDAHGARQRALWRASSTLWGGIGAALLSASLLLAASPATAADKAGAKAAPIKAATRAAAGSAAAQGPMNPSETLGPASDDDKASQNAPKSTKVAPPSRIPGMARFRSIGTDDTVMYDAPSDKAKKLYQAPRGMPVEVIAVLQAWVKVRDMEGDIAWVLRDDLSERRTVVASTTVPLYQEPNADAPQWFEAARGVVFELEDDKPDDAGFVRVRHADGQSGYVELGQVWGI